MRASRILIAVLPILAGCGDTSVAPIQLGPDLSVPEIRGNKLYVGAYGNLAAAVTADSQQIAFVGGLSDRILLVNAKTNAVSPLETGQGIKGVAAAGNEIYFVQQTDSSRYALFLLNQNAPQLVIENSALLPVQWPAEGKAVVASANGRSIAFVAKPDSLIRYDPVLGTRSFVRTGCDEVVAMSPDGSAVICYQRVTHSYTAYNMSTGGVRSDITIPSDVASRAHEVRWLASGVKVLFAEVGRYVLYDETTEQRTNLGDIIVAPSSLGVAQTAWSPDGQRIAFWQNYCAQTSGESCVKNQAFLMLYDVTLGGLRRVAVHNLPAGVRTGGAVVFTASGHDLYYIAGVELFVIPV